MKSSPNRLRAAAIPEDIPLSAALPMSSAAQEVITALQDNQVLVVAGETGSGKTTQLPKICLKAGYGRAGLIGHTQPRRLAAVSVANRIAEELGTEPGSGVAWQVRFHERSSTSSYLKVMTDGILLAELQGDRQLHRYEVLIIDEAHERSLNIDFLLGYLKRLLPKRPELKLIITSATIDVEKFSRHFDNAPVIQVSGRGYPVETRYAPLPVEDSLPADELQLRAIADAVGDILKTSSKGDILVFLSSEREIRETGQHLRKQKFDQLEILSLYARLRQSEQLKIFRPHKGRRVVLSTNVAETSLTVPGIVFVIDSGQARISRYSLHHKLQRLPVESVSRASADQRQGRCGRVAPGVCIRLYSEADYLSRPQFTDPEIQRTNLAAVILRMLSLGLGDVAAFPFIDPPEGKAINDGFRLLQELNAIDSKKELTESGRLMARLPTDPRLAAMLVNGIRHKALREMLIIVSAIGSQDPREYSAENRQAARQAWQEFSDDSSDFLGFVKLWTHYESQRQRLDRGQLRKHCRRYYLNFTRMQEWQELHTQLSLACQQAGLKPNRQPADYQAVHQCIIAGSLGQIARHAEGRNFLGTRNRRFHLFPSSVLYSKRAKWIVTGPLIETEDTFATLAARIEPQWIEESALHLLKRECFDPHWSTSRQAVMAYEKLSLYGLVLHEKKPVDYGGIDPAVARDIFIRDALVGGAIESKASFITHNQAFISGLEKQEKRLRKPESIVSERDLSRFYEAALPEDIYSTATLEDWLQGQSGPGREVLHLSEEKLQSKELSEEVLQAFPEQADIRHNRLQIDYIFEPGAATDGATLKVPLSVLGQLSQGDVDWAVPGLLRERCIALLKGLPKAQRKHFIPVSDFVDRVLPLMHGNDGQLLDSLSAQSRQQGGPSLTSADFSHVELPAHLQTKIAVLDEDGSELATDTDLQALQRRFGQSAITHGRQYGHALEARGMEEWSMDELPEEVIVNSGSGNGSGNGKKTLVLIRYPALVDQGDSVDLELQPIRQTAERLSRRGILRLYMLCSVQQQNRIRKQFSRMGGEHALLLAALGGGLKPALPEQALLLCYQEAFATGHPMPRNKAGFQARLDAGRGQVMAVADRLEALLKHLLQNQHTLRRRLSALPESLAYLQDDMDEQLCRLFAANFLVCPGGSVGSGDGASLAPGDSSDIPPHHLEWLEQYPRYLQAMSLRLDKAPHVGPKDRSHTEALSHLWQRYEKLAEAVPAEKAGTLVQLRWMLEEYRVSLFAQHLGTRTPVSEKRIEKLLQSPHTRER